MRTTTQDNLTHARLDLNRARRTYVYCKLQVKGASTSWQMAEKYYPKLISVWASIHGMWLVHCKSAKLDLARQINLVRALLEVPHE